MTQTDTVGYIVKEDVVIKTQKRICAWCKKVLQVGREPATHGICPECAQKEMPSYETK